MFTLAALLLLASPDPRFIADSVQTLSGVTMPDTVTVEGRELLLNGMAGDDMLFTEHVGHHNTNQLEDHHLTPHQMTASIMLMQSLFMMAMPVVLSVQSPGQGSMYAVPQPILPRQWALPPPDQPPRSSVPA